MKTDGIILDIDGTLWDSTPIVAKAWNEVIAQRKDVPVRLTPKQLTGLFGRTLEVIADMVFPFLEKEDRYTLINACCDREHELLYECNDDILYPGVADTIRSLSAKVRTSQGIQYPLNRRQKSSGTSGLCGRYRRRPHGI